MTLILASASPRRSELLESAGIPVEKYTPSADESSVTAANAKELCLKRAELKAECALEECKAAGKTDFVVLGADTVVEKDGRVYGKPKDEREAREMLRSLSNAEHFVYTAVVMLASDGTGSKTVQRTGVTFKEYDEKLIEKYIASRLCFGKAGAYGIQDEQLQSFVLKTDGERDNVIGLPLNAVRRMLEEKEQWLLWK